MWRLDLILLSGEVSFGRDLGTIGSVSESSVIAGFGSRILWKEAMITDFVNKDMKEKSEEIRDLIEGNKDKVKLLIGGDFIDRTRNKGGKEWGSREEYNKRFEEEAEKASSEVEIWKIVNGGRKRRKRVNQDIDVVHWKKYFMELLGGVENRIRKGDKEGKEGDQEEDITWEGINEAVDAMKDKKAAGIDEMPNEVWKY